MANNKRILVIGSGWEQYDLVKAIREEGHYIVATHPAAGAESFPLADATYVKHSRDIRAHLAIANTHRIDAVVSDNCDFSFYTAAIVASKLNLPFANLQQAIFSNDKFAQRSRCAAHNIVQPDFHQVRTLDDARNAAAQIGYPCILKPVDARGTFGVTILNSDTELEAAFYDAVSNSDSRMCILETFIEGVLVTVDGFCFSNGHRALAVASRKFEDGPKPVTKEIIYPAEFDQITNQRLLDNHHAVATALGYNYGHTHGEYILTHGGEIYLVECTNRGGGVYTSSTIVPLLTGIDLNRILLNQSLGTDTYQVAGDTHGMMQKSAMLTFLDFEENQVIRSINTTEVQELPFTVKFRSLYAKNDMVAPIEHCAGRHSMLVIEGPTVEDVKTNLGTFKSELNIEYYAPNAER